MGGGGRGGGVDRSGAWTPQQSIGSGTPGLSVRAHVWCLFKGGIPYHSVPRVGIVTVDHSHSVGRGRGFTPFTSTLCPGAQTPRGGLGTLYQSARLRGWGVKLVPPL